MSKSETFKRGEMVLLDADDDDNRTAVEFVSRSGGWTTFLTKDGTVKRARNSRIQKDPSLLGNHDRKRAKAEGKKAEKAEDGVVSGSVIPADVKERYVTGKTSEGARFADSGDALAKRLRGKSLDEVYKMASAATGDSVAALKRRYEHLNHGMQRMNLGNRIRAAQ